MRIVLAIVVFVVASVLKAAEADQTREFRSHAEIVQGDHVLYEFSSVTRLGDETEENVLLIRDIGHGDYVMTRRWSYKDQIVTHRLGSPKERAFIQISYKMPFTSKTRLETLAEGRQNPALIDTPVIARIETNGGEWEALHDELQRPHRLREFRRAVRQATDPAILETIERLRGTSLARENAFFELLGHYFVYESGPEETEKGVGTKRMASPNCAFDSKFGYPCSQKQLARIKKAAEDGKLLEMY